MSELTDEMLDRYYDTEFEELDVHLKATTCKVCKKKGLEWEMTPAGWRLFEGTQLHECIDPFKLVAAFEKTHPIHIKPGDRRRRVA